LAIPYVARNVTNLSIGAKRARVLVAEDDDDFRAIVAAALRADGFDVIAARSGDDLLERITPAVLFSPPDAIVADIWMPGLDGLAVTADLHALFQKPFEMRDLGRDLRALVARTGGWRCTAPTLPEIA
jgi:CheY-like chemotaxis protein